MRQRFLFSLFVVLVATSTLRGQTAVDLRDAARAASKSVVGVPVPSVGMDVRQRWIDLSGMPKPEGAAAYWDRMPADASASPQFRAGVAVAPNLVIGWRLSGEEPQIKIDGEVVSGKVLVRDNVTDLVAIQIESDALVPIALSTQKAQAGMPVMISSWDDDLVVHQAGMVASDLTKQPLGMHRLDVRAASSVAGSPVFDPSGRLLGLAITKGQNSMLLGAESIERLIVAAAEDQPKDLYRGVLGIQLQPNQGSAIESVMPDSPAQGAGLKVGDRVVRLNDNETETAADILAILALYRAGEEVEVEVDRDGERLAAMVVLDNLETQEKSNEEIALDDLQRQLYRLDNGKLVPLVQGVDDLFPLTTPELGARDRARYLRGDLKVERSKLEESLRALEEERHEQEKMIKKLRDRISELEEVAKEESKSNRAADIQRLEKLLQEIRRKIEDEQR